MSAEAEISRLAKGGSNTFPFKTGQTTSGGTGTDGDIQFGRGASWNVLDEVNPYGNLTKHLDDLGGTAYASGILIDWGHADSINKLVLGWSVAHNGVNITFANALAGALASTLGGYTDWNLPNIEVMRTLENHETSRGLNYTPFIQGGNERFWTGSQWNAATTYAQSMPNRPVDVSAVLKTTSSGMRYYVVRVFTYAELGL